MEKIKEKRYLITIFILLCIAFIIPSVVYIIKEKSIFNLNPNFSFFFTNTKALSTQNIISTIFFAVLLIGISITYYMILKNNKKIFTTKEQIAKFILIVSLIFFIMLPFTSSDVFYYIGTGWSEAKYEVNPYYTSVKNLMQNNEEAKEDIILQKTPEIWKDTTIVYGPIWPLVCKILSGMSMGNLSFALFIYKLFNLGIHLINTYLIYKITNKKKIFALIYGINPIILLEGLCNVHNDLLVVTFILLGIYFFIKKKKILPTVISLAIATAIKYYAILLIPFLIIYHYRKEKVTKRILYACGWAIVFIIVLILCYLLYMRDFQVLKGVFVQQSKYSNSIFLFMWVVFSSNIAISLSKGFMLAFIIIYLYNIIKLLFTKKEISLTKGIRIYNSLLILFIFGTITNFHTWYMLWLFPTIMFQKGKTINNILNITFATQLANVVYFAFNESYIYGKYYVILVILFIIISSLINKYRSEQACRK